jgi:hypothetical protein
MIFNEFFCFRQTSGNKNTDIEVAAIVRPLSTPGKRAQQSRPLRSLMETLKPSFRRSGPQD